MSTPEAGDGELVEQVAQAIAEKRGVPMEQRTDGMMAVWRMDARAALAVTAERIKHLEAEVAQLRETVTELWHDAKADHGSLHETLGMTVEEYGAWANPAALAAEPLKDSGK